MNSPQPEVIDPGPFLINSFGDHYLYSVNRNTFNEEGSAAIYRRKYKNLFSKKDQLYIILGSDGGLLINYCLQQELPKGSRYIFVDLEEIIAALPASVKEDLPDAIRLFSFDNFWKEQQSFQCNNYIAAKRDSLLLTFAVEDAHLLEYRNFYSKFDNKLQSVRRKELVKLQTAPFMEKMIINACDNRTPVNSLKNCFKGKTAVILGGGPSLDNILPWVKKNHNAIIVIAVSRICSQLLKENISPHIIVTVDPQEISFTISREMFFFEKTSLLVASNHIPTSIASQWGGISVYDGLRLPWQSPLNFLNNNLSKGTTVTNSALGLAFFMGCSRIILGGVDFCFSKKGFSHAAGSNEYKAGPKLTNVVPIETNSGEIADTRPDYYQACKEMEKQVQDFIAGGTQIINPSFYSAKMEGVEYIPLQDIALEAAPQAPLQVMCSILPKETQETRLNDYRQIKKELEDKCSTLIKANKLFKEALQCNAKVSSTRKKAQTDAKAKRRIDQIEENLKKNFTDFFNFIRAYNISGLIQATTERTEEESWSKSEANEFLQKYYTNCLESGRKIYALLQEALTTVEMRLEEEKKIPDIEKLIHFWKEKKQHGRAKIWREQHKELWQEIAEKEQHHLQQTADIFTNFLTSSDEKPLQIYKNYSKLTGIPSTALNHFQFKDKKALLRLTEGLKHHPDKADADKLLTFVNALLAELEGDTESALALYNSLIKDNADSITENVLRRIFILCLDLQQYEDAFLAAECLTGISITNAPFLAKLYELGGDKPKALEIYTEYLEQTGLNVAIMHKMAKIYLELGIVDGAELMYSSILQQDPDNRVAQKFFTTKQGGHA